MIIADGSTVPKTLFVQTLLALKETVKTHGLPILDTIYDLIHTERDHVIAPTRGPQLRVMHLLGMVGPATHYQTIEIILRNTLEKDERGVSIGDPLKVKDQLSFSSAMEFTHKDMLP